MNITRGIIPTAKKVVVYGPEGIGKTTFASRFPGAVFLDTEGSTVHMDVARLDNPVTWADILATVDWAIENHDAVGTFVIDTMDWAEAMAFREVCKEKKVGGIEDIPYGKGYVFAKDKVRDLLARLDRLKDTGTNIVLTAHAIVRKFEQPDELGSYDRYSLKLNEKNIAPLIKEWADLLLFANYKTDIITTQDGKKKATGGRKRVMYTAHAAAWDAKSRFDLPEELPFEFDAIAGLFGPSAAAAASPRQAGATETSAEPARIAPETPPPAKVTKQSSVKKKAEKALPDRPAAMQSENPEKDAALAHLWERMAAADVADPLLLQGVVAEREYYPSDIPPAAYDTDFITDCLLEAWEPVSKRMLSLKNNLPF